MSKWFESRKWTDEKLSHVMDFLDGLINYGYSETEILLPNGHIRLLAK